MFVWRVLCLLLIATASLGGYSSSARPKDAHVSVGLISSTDRPRPGQTFVVGFRIVPKTGWHTYWSNPGESGLPTTVKWQASPNLQFGALLHPAPSILKVAGMTSFVHSDEHVLLARIRVNSSLKPKNSTSSQSTTVLGSLFPVTLRASKRDLPTGPGRRKRGVERRRPDVGSGPAPNSS